MYLASATIEQGTVLQDQPYWASTFFGGLNTFCVAPLARFLCHNKLPAQSNDYRCEVVGEARQIGRWKSP